MWGLTAVLELLFPNRRTETLARTSSVETLGVHAEPILHTIDTFRCTSLLPYREPHVRALVLEAKFHALTHAHRVLGGLLKEHLEQMVSDDVFHTHTYVLVPIPLSKKRMRERGHNQIESSIRCALTPPLEGIVCDTRLLRRVRDTTPQTRLPRRERLHNMRGAFRVVGTVSPSTHYIIVDDVMTTGATLTAAAHALRDAGATSLEMIALAH